jgi:virulence-associated protein VagC
MSETHSAKEIALGERNVTDMNYSKVVTLPKAFTDNYLNESRIVHISLSPDGRLILTPTSKRKVANGG